ncbi:hypothetical protein [Moorena producens]|uniref:hypothetical protein n=1 Tax=Moorena producens TaxID=1155739 RepID=UPI0011EA6F6C|nr:hypothetical protein [Moorena producens]
MLRFFTEKYQQRQLRLARRATLRDEAFRQSRRFANAKRGQRPQLPPKAIASLSKQYPKPE